MINIDLFFPNDGTDKYISRLVKERRSRIQIGKKNEMKKMEKVKMMEKMKMRR